MRKHNEGLALGSVGFRLIEGALYIGIVLCLLLLVTLSQEAANAGAAASSAYQVQAGLLMAARDSLGEVAVLAFGLGALMYYWVFYRSRLVPRWLSAWGLVAIASLMLSGLLVMFGVIEPLSPPQVVLALPIFLQEMVLAVWLIAKGFDPSAIAPESAGDTSGWRATASTASGSRVDGTSVSLSRSSSRRHACGVGQDGVMGTSTLTAGRHHAGVGRDRARLNRRLR